MKTLNTYKVYYTFHHWKYNTGHDMHVKAYNKREAIDKCQKAVYEKCGRYAFNCMAILDGPKKFDDKHQEKYIDWAKTYDVYKPNPKPFVLGR